MPAKPLKLIIISILVVGVLLRFANIDQKTFWLDESASLYKISGYTSEVWNNKLPSSEAIAVRDLQQYYTPNSDSNILDVVRLLSNEDAKHVPLYFVLLRLWADLFGSSVTALRLLSATVSLIAIPSIFWLCLELFRNSTVAWVGMGLIAVSPFQLLYAQEARMYILQAVLILLSSAALLAAMRVKTKLH